MCDLICEVMIPHIAFWGSLKDVVIEHIKCYGQKCKAFFDYPLFDNCSFSLLMELLYAARDEEYGATIIGANKLQFMSFNPSNNNNIMQSNKRWLTFEQVWSLETNFELKNKLGLKRKMQLAMELGL